MDKLKINLKNCYGIKSLEYEFDFQTNQNIRTRAYAIYAPNGLMKTSFARTFDDLCSGNSPKDERFARPSIHVVEADGTIISKESIYVLKSEIDVSADSPSISNVLVDPASKSRYDELVVEIDKSKTRLVKDLQKSSGLKQSEVEEMLLKDFQETDFFKCVQSATEAMPDDDLKPFVYNIIFDSKAKAVLESSEFTSKANEFKARYQELFEQNGTLYQKGVFNPTKAETSFDTLKSKGFFSSGHRIHLRGEENSINREQLDDKLRVIHEKIDNDPTLKSIQKSLGKNAQTEALTALIENLTSYQFEYLLDKLKPENHVQFKRDLWTSYIQASDQADNYLNISSDSRDELRAIETQAAQTAPRWTKAVTLFNDRFIGMPFELSISNQALAVLGKEKAILKFTFRDGQSIVDRSRDEVRLTLSQGEKRALHLLNFIFDVEVRIANNTETVFILDDIADSFDYKNKHAIIQYLEDLSDHTFFHQIILTHNFDFFRALATHFVHRNRCLMTSKDANCIYLTKAEGIKNYFTKIWKPKIETSNTILWATIPFTRNIIEYTRSDTDPNYLQLTSLLHWKSDTAHLTVGQYFAIYNQIFATQHPETSTDGLFTMLFTEAQRISAQPIQDALCLENKVLLSIAIRMQAEIYLTNQIRLLTHNAGYWCQKKNQFGNLVKDYTILAGNVPALRTIEKVSVTVSTNIHLNSFMYEPILDLTIDHLISLYGETEALNT